MNVISEDHSENLGRCIYHSLGMSCQETVQVMGNAVSIVHGLLYLHLLTSS